MSYVHGHVFLTAEDDLGLACGRRLLGEHECLTIWREHRAGGYGDLKTDLSKYNNMAKSGNPVLMLTDLDTQPCATAFLAAWFGKKIKPNENLLLRICRHEVEAWLLAHPASLSDLFKLPLNVFSNNPEAIVDPKAELLRLAGRAPRKIREALLPAAGSLAKIGPDYNPVLCELVEKAWSPYDAGKMAPSLERARLRVADLAARVIASTPK